MKLLPALALVIACAAPRATTPAPLRCARSCPAAEPMEPLDPPLADCCTDARGDTWSSCAWERHVACEARTP